MALTIALVRTGTSAKPGSRLARDGIVADLSVSNAGI
jgi:hypothetical protein